MSVLKDFDISIISFIILIFIYVNVHNRKEKAMVQYRLFSALLLTNMALIIVDILGWVFNELPGKLYLFLNTGSNLLLYIMAPMGAFLWALFSNYQVFFDTHRLRKLSRVLLAVFLINALISVFSLWTGWFFSVDGSNLYERGKFFWVHVALCYSLLTYSIILILINRDIIEKRHYYSLLFFALPQLAGSSLQVFFYGLSYNWAGMMLSLLVIYINIQNRGLNTDYLTGVYNRRQLDRYVNDKIRSSTENKTFSAILIDLNNFKQINDQYGHLVGDEALLDVVSILRKSLRSNDFIARYGGDEFYIVLDIDQKHVLDIMIERMLLNVESFNQESQKPYRISFCLGYAIYDSTSKMNADDFFKHIDVLMYNNKKCTLKK